MERKTIAQVKQTNRKQTTKQINDQTKLLTDRKIGKKSAKKTQQQFITVPIEFNVMYVTFEYELVD